jgi:tetratricopeptide (TPR) repeat protein
MDSFGPNQTLRVPPAVAGASGELAQALQRRDVVSLDEVTRARMERSLIQAWRTHASANVALPAARRATSLLPRRGTWVASLAGSAVAGALIAFFVLVGDRHAAAPIPGFARFELRIGDSAVQSGSLNESQVLESGKLGHIEVDLGSARVHMERATRLRLDRLSASELNLSLLEGRIEVDFHPRHKGEQRMAIESTAARVQVVGTRFAVQVDALGNTDVRVREGVVEVVPRSGAETQRVAAGGETYVRVDDGDEYERAVRQAIEQNVHSLDPVALPQDRTAGVADKSAIKPDMDFSDEFESDLAAAAANTAVRNKLAMARRQLRQGHHGVARAKLRGIADSAGAGHYRIEALTLIAESYTAQGDLSHAAQAYQRAAELAPADPAGHNARFALGRLLERYARDEAGAASAYRRYLERAPQGALASQARQALCRLGDASYCE